MTEPAAGAFPAAADEFCIWLAGAVHGLLSREGFAVEPVTDTGGYLPVMILTHGEGHRYEIRVRYAGPLSTRELAAIATTAPAPPAADDV